jgi:hypothetical protein
MKIKKITAKKDKIGIDYDEPVKGGQGSAQKSLVSPEPAAPEFYQAFKDLKPHLLDLVELDLDKKLVTVTGVSISFQGADDVPAAVITGQMAFKNSNGVLPLNSPVKTFDPLKGDKRNPKSVLTEECVEALRAVLDAATGYLKGKRGQTDMFDEQEKGKKNGKK